MTDRKSKSLRAIALSIFRFPIWGRSTEKKATAIDEKQYDELIRHLTEIKANQKVIAKFLHHSQKASRDILMQTLNDEIETLYPPTP